MEVLDAAVVDVPAVPSDEALGWLVAAANDNRDGTTPLRTTVETMLGILRLRFEDCIKATLARMRKQRRDCKISVCVSSRQGQRVWLWTIQLIACPTRTSSRSRTIFCRSHSSRPSLTSRPRRSTLVGAYSFSLPSPSDGATIFALPHIYTTLAGPSKPHWRWLLETIVALIFQRPGIQLGWLASRFSSTVGDKEVVGTSFSDVWCGVGCLVRRGWWSCMVGREGWKVGRFILEEGLVWGGFPLRCPGRMCVM